MRFNLPSSARAKAFAQDLHHYVPGAKLSALQELAARVYGYADWHELTEQAGRATPNEWDFEDGPFEYERQTYQGRILEQWLGDSYHRDVAFRLHAYLTPTREKPEYPCEGVNLMSARDNIGLALAQSRLFPAGEDVHDWMESTRTGLSSGDVPDSLDLATGVPAEVRAALSQPREWGIPEWEKTLAGVVQRVWFRRAGFYRGELTWAAVWRWEVEGAKTTQAPAVRCVVEFLWAAPAAQMTIHRLGTQVAHVRWRQILAHWMPETAVGYFVPPPLQMHVPASDLSLPALMTVCRQANFQRETMGDVSGFCMHVFLEKFAFLAASSGGHLLEFGTVGLSDASRARLEGDPQGSQRDWRIRVIEQLGPRHLDETVAGPGSAFISSCR